MSKTKHKPIAVPTPTHNKTSASQFFAQCPWKDWHDEFFKGIAKNGGRKYKTAWQFAKANGKTDFEKKLIYEAIGPQPTVEPGKKLRVKWLGDWQKERDDSFWKYSKDKEEAIKAAFEENTQLRQELSKLTPYAKRMLKRISVLAEHLDDHFGEYIMHPDLDSDENKNRLNMYLNALDRITDLQDRVMKQVCLTIGLNPDDRNSWTQVAMVALAQDAAEQGVVLSAGSMTTSRQRDLDGETGRPVLQADAQQSDDTDLTWVVAAARMIKNKSKAYAMPLPEVEGIEAEA